MTHVFHIQNSYQKEYIKGNIFNTVRFHQNTDMHAYLPIVLTLYWRAQFVIVCPIYRHAIILRLICFYLTVIVNISKNVGIQFFYILCELHKICPFSCIFVRWSTFGQNLSEWSVVNELSTEWYNLFELKFYGFCAFSVLFKRKFTVSYCDLNFVILFTCIFYELKARKKE